MRGVANCVTPTFKVENGGMYTDGDGFCYATQTATAYKLKVTALLGIMLFTLIETQPQGLSFNGKLNYINNIFWKQITTGCLV